MHGRIQGERAESTQQKKSWHKWGRFISGFVDVLAWPHLSCVCQRESSGLRFCFCTQVKTGCTWALLGHAGFHSSCSFMTAAITAIQIKYDPSFYLTPAIRGKRQAYLDSSHSGFITQGSVFPSYPFSTQSGILTRNKVCPFNQQNADECESHPKPQQSTRTPPFSLHIRADETNSFGGIF